MDTTPTTPPGPADGAAAEPHGDPLMDAAQGRETDGGSRQGRDASESSPGQGAPPQGVS
jgi:hypothetical protein